MAYTYYTTRLLTRRIVNSVISNGSISCNNEQNKELKRETSHPSPYPIWTESTVLAEFAQTFIGAKEGWTLHEPYKKGNDLYWPIDSSYLLLWKFS